jgi:type IV secretory pathway VirB6-like protein
MKNYLLQKLFLFSAGIVLITMMDSSLVAWVGFDVVWMNIDGISVCVALYWIVGGCHPRLLSFSSVDDDPKMTVLFLVLCIILCIF